MFNKIRRLIHKPWKRSFRFFLQRRTRGWDDGDTFSLDYSLAKVILPRLKRFKKLTIAVPCELEEKEWHDILDKMIAAFEFSGSESRWSADQEEFLKHQEGLDLFAQYYWALWW
jgi:hypothetical protein